MNRIFPQPTTTPSVSDAYPEVDGARPWIVLSMVATIDGAISVAGTSGGLGNDGDREIFRRLRDRADLIVVSAGTARAERYRPTTRPGQRIAVVTGSGNFEPGTGLSESAATLAIMPIDGPEVGIANVRAGRGRADVAEAIRLLNPRCALIEGGPSLNGPLLEAGAVDEICMTIAPFTAAGSGPRMSKGGLERLIGYELTQVLEQGGYLYCTYRRR